MNWKKEVFSSFKLYGVTDTCEDSKDILKKIDRAYAGGADIIQLRSKTLEDGALYRLALRIRKIAERRKKLFFMNDRIDLAIAARADGVHLGQEDLPVGAARQILSRARFSMWIGKSTHNAAQARMAQREGADYIGVGPVFKTPTKPDYRPAGLAFVRQAAEQIQVPFVAIGGINLSNISSVLEAGARRIAVVRAIFEKENPYEAAYELRKKIENAEKK
ncbi:MAG TPA: thiamine phosphate synthase [bacterium]|nr:thiamine phosphate synthase [bacterium]